MYSPRKSISKFSIRNLWILTTSLPNRSKRANKLNAMSMGNILLTRMVWNYNKVGKILLSMFGNTYILWCIEIMNICSWIQYRLKFLCHTFHLLSEINFELNVNLIPNTKILRSGVHRMKALLMQRQYRWWGTSFACTTFIYPKLFLFRDGRK